MVRASTSVEHIAPVTNLKKKSFSEQTEVPKSAKRPRSLTTLKLEVISERTRKMQRIKDALANNSYEVESPKLAKVLMDQFDEHDIE